MTPAPANTPPRRISHPRPRLRKAVKWGGLILSIVLVAAWVASAWVRVGYFSKLRIGVAAGEGVIYLAWERGPSPSRFWGTSEFLTHPPVLAWSFDAFEKPPARGVVIPFWALTLPTIALTIFAWRRDAAARRRALHNHCPACGYDRAGLLTPDAVCPECGAAAPTAAPATERTARPTR